MPLVSGQLDLLFPSIYPNKKKMEYSCLDQSFKLPDNLDTIKCFLKCSGNRSFNSIDFKNTSCLNNWDFKSLVLDWGIPSISRFFVLFLNMSSCQKTEFS